MLLSYSVKNFRTLKEKCTFSMKPGRKMKRFEDNVITSKSGIRGLKSAVIVGENGGGKTNFIESLDFLKYLFNSTDPIETIRSLLHYDDASKESTQEFQISIEIDGLIYCYYLLIDGISIKEECLDIVIDKSKKIEVYKVKRIKYNESFNRSAEIEVNWQLNGAFIEESMMDSEIASSAKGLFITKLELLGAKIVKPFCEWIKNKLVIHSPSDLSYATFLEIKEEEQNLQILQQDSFMEIFQLVDPSIKELEIDEEEPFKDSVVIREGENGKLYRTKMSKESSGIRDFFAWSIDIWKVVHDDCTVFADEMDKVLNPLLSERVITFIHGSEHKGQFIFSTHNVLHMNTINFMKQQLWIITRQKYDMSSHLYSLAEYEEFRYDKTNIYELYLKGLLGGTIDG